MDKTTPSDETVVTSSATESNTVISEDSAAVRILWLLLSFWRRSS